jgi:Mn2+/Fe2+ NRAMP family transporter
MGEYVNGARTNIIGWITFAAMSVAAIAMVVGFLR